jgi:hypothetical protein
VEKGKRTMNDESSERVVLVVVVVDSDGDPIGMAQSVTDGSDEDLMGLVSVVPDIARTIVAQSKAEAEAEAGADSEPLSADLSAREAHSRTITPGYV